MGENFIFHFGKYSYEYNVETKIHHAKEYDQELPVKVQPPVYLQVMASNYCNLKCSYCYAGSGPTEVKTNEWMKEHLEDILIKFTHQGLTSVVFGGGEPLAQDWLLSVISNLRETTQIEISITTNGTLLTEEIVGFLQSLQVSVRLSINTMQEYHQRKAGLDLLLDSGMKFGINSMLTSKNHDLFEKIIPNLISKNQVDLLLLESQQIGRGGLPPLTKEEIHERILKLKLAAKNQLRSVILSSRMEYLFDNPKIWRYPPDLVNTQGFLGSLSSGGVLRHSSFCPDSCGVDLSELNVKTVSEVQLLEIWDNVAKTECLRFTVVNE